MLQLHGHRRIIHARATPQLHDYLEGSAQRSPEKVALVCEERRLTYGEIDAQSTELANALVRRGVRRGDRVVVLSDNTVESVIGFWGVLKANAVVSMVGTQIRSGKLTYLVNDCRARVLVADARHAGLLDQLADKTPYLDAVILSGCAEAATIPAVTGVVDWNDALRAESGAAAPPRECLDVDLAAIVYTSGSTGEPKGVMLTHRNMLAAATSISMFLENEADDVIFSALPLSFDYGLYQMILAFRVGARLILSRSFSYAAEGLQTMAKERATAFAGVPMMFALIGQLRSPKQNDLSAIRYVTSTAGALHPKHIAIINNVFPGARLFSMYGLTECKRCTYLPPEDIDRKPGSVGIAIPNTELWIVGEDGEKLPPNSVGQLVVRGATVMKGYWEKPEATANVLRPGPIPGESVLYTGDRCYLDADGYVYFVARMDDIIKSRGEKVPPIEVESALMSIDGVREAAVIGVPDEMFGQAVKAFVVLHDGVRLGERDLLHALQSRLEAFMIPKRLAFVDALPRTANGKVDKSLLR